MEKRVPVKTAVGELRGRDCIYLDAVSFEDGTETLILRGEINGNLCSPRIEGAFIPYSLRFTGVLALMMIELDSWDWKGVSPFDEVLQSKWLRKLGGKVSDEHRHYVVQTYDDVFEIVCEGWTLDTQPDIPS